MCITTTEQMLSLYGQHSEAIFSTHKNIAVAEAASAINAAQQDPEKLQGLFQRVLDQLSSARKRTAIESGSEDLHLFGRDRKYNASDFDLTYTFLTERYENASKQLTTKIQSILGESIPTIGKLPKKEFKVKSRFNDRATSIEVNLYTVADVQKKKWDDPGHDDTEKAAAYERSKLSPEDKRNIQKLNGINFPETPEEETLAQKHYSVRKEIKNKFPNCYEHARMSNILQKFEKSYPELGDVLLTEQEIDQMERSGESLNVIYVLTKVRCEINKKMYCLTQYLTRTYQDGRTDPVEQMRGVPVVALHHDRFLIQDTLKEIETIFQRAVLWNKETQDLKELTDDIGTMTYLFAHCMVSVKNSHLSI